MLLMIGLHGPISSNTNLWHILLLVVCHFLFDVNPLLHCLSVLFFVFSDFLYPALMWTLLLVICSYRCFECLNHYSLHVDSVNTDLYTLIQSVNVEVIGMVVAINSRRTCTWFFVRLIWYVCATARRHQRMQQAAASCWRISATTRYQTYSCLISLITLWSSLKINMDLGLCLFVCEFLLLAFLYLHQWSYMKQKFAET